MHNIYPLLTKLFSEPSNLTGNLWLAVPSSACSTYKLDFICILIISGLLSLATKKLVALEMGQREMKVSGDFSLFLLVKYWTDIIIGDDWILECNHENWSRDEPIRLKHYHTNGYDS